MRALIVMLAMWAGSAFAAPITFSLSFQGNGTLDGVEFNDVPVTLDFRSDTLFSVPFTGSPCCTGYQNFILPQGDLPGFDNGATATIEGVATVTFTERVLLFINLVQDSYGLLPNPIDRGAAFYYSGAGLSPSNPYEMDTSTTFTGFYRSSRPLGFFTDGGDLFLSAEFNAPVVFTAQLVPVPAAFWLMASALGILGWRRTKVVKKG